MIFVLQCLRAGKEKAVCSGGCRITNEPFALDLNDKESQSRMAGAPLALGGRLEGKDAPGWELPPG